MSNWTNDDRKKWEATWNEPHMRRGLAMLREFSLVDAKIEVAPGYDMLVLGATLGYSASGKAAMLEEIAAMGRISPEKKPLPKEFERTPPPQKRAQ